MSISRRKFLRTGTLVALAAAIPVTVFAQNPKDRDGNPFDQQYTDPLSTYNKAAFQSYLNSIFKLYTGYSTVEVALIRVSDLPSAGAAAPAGGESFSLLFVGGSQPLKQNTYKVDHPSLGSFLLFLVPAGADDNGAQLYLATINRIGYSPDLVNPPTRGTKTTDKPGAPTVTSPVPATPSPSPKPEDSTPTPATNPKQKLPPLRRPKPSWKTDGFKGDTDGLVIDN